MTAGDILSGVVKLPEVNNLNEVSLQTILINKFLDYNIIDSRFTGS